MNIWLRLFCLLVAAVTFICVDVVISTHKIPLIPVLFCCVIFAIGLWFCSTSLRRKI